MSHLYYLSYFLAPLLLQCSIQETECLGEIISDPLNTIRSSANGNEAALGYNEDAILNFTGLTKKYGYVSEEHTVVTEDGYVLTVYRLPGGKRCEGNLNYLPVIVVHGLLESSDDFIISGPGYGLGYILADACYDTWLLNVRGNRYSRNHVTLNPDKDDKFWEFSFDEFGFYDVRATIDYVLKATDRTQVKYIGHSQGGSDVLILTSMKPEYNDKILVSVLLAPAPFQYHLTSVPLRILSAISAGIKALYDTIRLKEVLPRQGPSATSIEFFCQFIPEILCGSLLFAFTGLNPDNLPRERLEAISGHFPAGTSIRNLDHFAQLTNAPRFAHYDYRNKKKNVAAYGRSKPPEYNLAKVRVPTAILRGEQDLIITGLDIEMLSARLPNVIEVYTMPRKDFSHLDFVWGDDVPTQLAPKVLEYLELFDNDYTS